MLEDQLRYCLLIALENIDTNCLTPQLWNRFIFRPRDESIRDGRHKAGHDLDWQSTGSPGNRKGPKVRPIIDFSADVRRDADGGQHLDELCMKSFLLKEASLLSQNEWKGNYANACKSDSDLIRSVDRDVVKKTGY